MAQTYEAKSIQVLEGLDAVRMRPGMYIGSTGSRGLHHLLWEIVDNAIDEAANGYADEILVTLHQDGSASVFDNGRGMPVDTHPTLGISGVEVIYTKLHAGGKFNNENYSYSGGLHGVGASVVNALSKWVTVDVFRDWTHWRISFASKYDPKLGKVTAGIPQGPLEKVGNTRKKGSLVRFLPDDTIFEDTRFNSDLVARHLQEQAFLNKGLRIVFTDERDKNPETRERIFHYEGGIVDFVKYLDTDKNVLHEQPVYLEGQREDIIFKASFQYTDGYTENIFSYANNIPTGEGGSHETGFKAAFTKDISYHLLDALFRTPRFWRAERELTEKAMDLLAIFNLADKADWKASSLPYGQQRKLEIARALATNMKVLLLDEPAAGMNPTETAELLACINTIRDRFGVAILLIEHDMSLVMNVCQRIQVIDYGQTIAAGLPEEIASNPRVIAAYLGE